RPGHRRGRSHRPEPRRPGNRPRGLGNHGRRRRVRRRLAGRRPRPERLMAARHGAPVITIEPMTEGDAEAVLAIYGEGIATGVATFETTVPEWRVWEPTPPRDCPVVARLDDLLGGWAALGADSSPRAYRGGAWERGYAAGAAP